MIENNDAELDVLDAAVAALDTDERDGMGHAPETAAAVAAAAAVTASGGNLGFQMPLDYDTRVAATVEQAAGDVVDVLGNALGWGIFEHLTFREADVLATLAHRAGRTDVAQAMMLEWATLDDDAAERLLDLQDWGVERGPGGWAVSGSVGW